MRPGAEARSARILSVGRNAAWLVFDDESRPRAASLPKRQLRLSAVPGDLVLARPLEDGRAIVDAVEPREFALQRRTAGGRTKTMAANVDTLAIVIAFDRPALNLAMLDELLAFGELHERRSVVIFTKPDLVSSERNDELCGLYRRLGYETFAINPKAGSGVAEVEGALSRHRSLLIGQSGVGKSSLFRALGGEGAVGDLSRSGRGRQTTTSARLLRFERGFLIDSPGVGEFTLHPALRAPEAEWCGEVAYGFKEFRGLVAACRFSDCTHRTEPGCAVHAGVESSRVAATRYASYLSIVGRETIPG